MQPPQPEIFRQFYFRQPLGADEQGRDLSRRRVAARRRASSSSRSPGSTRVHSDRPRGNQTSPSRSTTKQAEDLGHQGAYQQGHLYMFPHQATGRFPYSTIDYPAFTKDLQTRRFLPQGQRRVSPARAIIPAPSRASRFALKDGIVAQRRRRRNLRRSLARVSQISEDSRADLSASRSSPATGGFTRPVSEPIRNLQTARRKHGGQEHFRAEQRRRDPLGIRPAASFTVRTNRWNRKSGSILRKRTICRKITGGIFTTCLSPIGCTVRGTKNTWLTLIEKANWRPIRARNSRAGVALRQSRRSARRRLGAAYPGHQRAGPYEDYAKDPWKTYTEVMKKVECRHLRVFLSGRET